MSERKQVVLVADDEPDILELVCIRIEQFGYQVLQARDGVEALTTARREKPDLCVLDVMMPGLDGHGVARELRATPELAGVPILMLTARASAEDEVAGLTAGADAYMAKPFTNRELRSHVEHLLSMVPG